jgi:hypothetical protein
VTGPEHYKHAEDLLADMACTSTDSPEAREHVAVAQVHAILALAAATALGSLRVDDHGMPPADANAWLAATSGDDFHIPAEQSEPTTPTGKTAVA